MSEGHTNHGVFDMIEALKSKFKRFFYHKKKLMALENYAGVGTFKHKDYLILIKKCMADGFLGEHEASFLTYMVDKYFPDSNFLDWTHRTKWLKGEISRLTQHVEEKKNQQMPSSTLRNTKSPP